MVFPHVVIHAGRAQEGAGDAVGQGVFLGNHADAFHAVDKNAVPGDEAVHLFEHLARFLERLEGFFLKAFGQVGFHAAHARVRNRDAGARDVLHQFVEIFARLDHVKKHGESAHFHGGGAHAGEVVGHARDFAHDHADILGALRDVDAEKFFNGRGVAEIVDKRRDVIEPVGVRHHLPVTALLGHFFKRAVEKTDFHVGIHHGFAVQLEQDAHNAVHGRMRRAHVEEHRFTARGFQVKCHGFSFGAPPGAVFF